MSERALKKKKNKKLLYFLIAGLILMTSGIIYYLLLPSKESDEVIYQTGQVKQGDLVVSLDGSGVIMYSEEVEITSSVNGKINELYVGEGSVVSAGDSILKVDSGSTEYQLEQAYNDLKSAQYKLADLLQTTVDKIDKVTFNDLSTVYAPSDGVVKYSIQNGATVNTNTPVMTIENNSIYFVAEIYESDLSQVKAGQSVSIYSKEYDGYYTGVVERISNVAHSNGKDMVYDAWIKVDNSGILKGGMTGTAYINTANSEVTKAGKFVDNEGRQIYPKISGNIDQIYVASGDYVKKGEPLFKVSNTSLVNQIETQKISIDNIRLKIADLESGLSDLVVKSDYSGVISDLYVTPNQTISNNTKIAKLVSDQFVARIEVDELDINKVQIGQEASLFIPAVSNDEIYGTVSYISNKGIVKDGITTYEVYISVEQNDLIKSGMTVDASIILAKTENALLVPTSSLIDIKGGKAVRVLEDGEIVGKPVEMGLSNDTMTEIISGIELTDVIITSLTYPSSTSSSTTPSGSSLMPTSVQVPGISGPGGGGGGGGTGSGK